MNKKKRGKQYADVDKRGENAGAQSLGAFEVKNGGRSTGAGNY